MDSPAVSVLCAADYFLAKAGPNLYGADVSTLCYFAHGNCLAILDRPLFRDAVHAGPACPYIPALAREFHGADTPIVRTLYGSLDLSDMEVRKSVAADNASAIESSGVHGAVDLMDSVLAVLSRTTLLNRFQMMAGIDSPWYTHKPPAGESNPIPNSELRAYFHEMLGGALKEVLGRGP